MEDSKQENKQEEREKKEEERRKIKINHNFIAHASMETIKT